MKKSFLVTAIFGLALVVGTWSISNVGGVVSAADAPTPEARLAAMTVEEKVGQMVCVAFRNWNGEGQKGAVTALNPELEDAITNFNLGGICLFAENCVETEQTVKLTDQIQRAASKSSTAIPMLITVDQEGGYVTRFNTGTSGPGNMALAATGKVGHAHEMGAIIGRELVALGFNTNFGPSLDVNNNANNPIIGVRSFSDDPDVVAKYGKAYIDGLHASSAISCAKHFPGHGDTDVDSHTGFPKIDKSFDELMATELKPFAAAADATDMVMTAHIQFPQVEKESYISIKSGEKVNLPATLSKTIITDVLRGQFGYEGVVCTDSLGMAAISANFKKMDSAKLAILADVDILLMPIVVQNSDGIKALKEYLDGIVAMVKGGEIPEAALDDSVLRILRMKEKYGVMTPPSATVEERVANALKVVGSKAHHDAEWEMALDAVTEYKNDRVLPVKLKKNASILYLSPNESLVRSAEYAVARLRREKKLDASVKLDVVNYGAKAGKTLAASKLADADVVLLATRTTGLDMLDVDDPENVSAIFVRKTIDDAHKLNKKVVVISAHLPYDAGYYDAADAVLLVYNPSGMTETPVEFVGKTAKYGPNVPAAIYEVFGGAKPTGASPVKLDVLKK